jgi:hypothetical protein
MDLTGLAPAARYRGGPQPTPPRKGHSPMAKRNETAWCCRCRKETTWTGTDRRLYCGGCGADFPCSHDCVHWDCLEAKGLAAPDQAGILRLIPSVPAVEPCPGASPAGRVGAVANAEEPPPAANPRAGE